MVAKPPEYIFQDINGSEHNLLNCLILQKRPKSLLLQYSLDQDRIYYPKCFSVDSKYLKIIFLLNLIKGALYMKTRVCTEKSCP